MTIEYSKKIAVFGESATIDEADTFWEWLINHSDKSVDLSACTYVHTVILQLLMASKVKIKAWPSHTALRSLLQTAITTKGS